MVVSAARHQACNWACRLPYTASCPRRNRLQQQVVSPATLPHNLVNRVYSHQRRLIYNEVGKYLPNYHKMQIIM